MIKPALSLILACSLGACVVPLETSGDTEVSDGVDKGGAGTTGDSGCSAAATFMDVGPYAGEAGTGYPAPALAVRCEGTNVVVTSNGIPHYEFFSITPNGLAAQNHVYTFPQEPVVAAATTPIPLLGVVALGVNGLPVYGPNEAEVPDPYGDPVYNEIVDFCKGHTGHRGDYHYHALLVQCLSDLGVDATPGVDVVSPVIGWALDGFPIYGPLGCLDEACTEVVEFQSGWERTGDPVTYAWDNHAYVAKTDAVYLDQCNGRVGPDGTYRYHATSGFPYVLGCYAGTPGMATNGGGGNPGGGDPGGGNPGGGNPDGGNNGPSACEEDVDCTDACPQAPLGCRCAETPTGEKRCIPQCTTDSDCPDGGPANLVCDTDEGLCVPSGTGGGTGGNPPPGDSGAGSLPPGDLGPTTCEEDTDCVDACPGATKGCRCVGTPTGEKHCVPECTIDSDCPDGGPMTLVCNAERGICVPEGMPGGP